MAEYLDDAYRVGMRRVCMVGRIGRATYYYRSVSNHRAIRQRILEIPEAGVWLQVDPSAAEA